MKGSRLYFVCVLLWALLALIPYSALASGTVMLPMDLEEIGAEAFMGDTSLDEVIVPEGVKRIGSNAFAGSGIQRIFLPNSLISIASNAFSNTDVLGVAEEGSYAADFFRANNLKLEIDPVVSEVVIEEGNVTLFLGESMTLHAVVQAKGEAKLGVGWTTGNPDVVTITNSGEIQAVQTGTAMIYATSIDDIAYTTAITVTVKEAADESDWISLEPTSLTLTENETATLRALVPEALKDGSGILWTSSNESVATVSSQGLVTGVSQGSAVIRAALASDAEIFAQCDITVEQGPDETSSRDFDYSINSTGDCTITYYKGNEKAVVIPRSINGHPVTGIGKSSQFHGKTYSIGFILPNTIKSIGDWAFMEDGWSDMAGFLYISTPGYPIEKNCVYLPDSIQSIGKVAFYGRYIKEIHLPKNLTSLGDSAFEETILQSIKLPDSLLSISKFAFCGSTLQHVDFPANLREIGLAAFEYCHFLTEIVLPSSVTQIAERAFNGCSALKKVYVPANASYESNSFPAAAEIISYYGDTPPVDNVLTMTAEDMFMGVGMGAAPKLVFSDGVDRSGQVTLTSSAPAVAAVSDGKISALSIGDAIVTAEIPSMDLSVTFTVRVRHYISPASVSLNIGESEQLRSGYAVILNGGPNDNLTNTGSEQWSSSNHDVATVNAKGKVTAVGKGEATITCKLPLANVYSTCLVKVTGELELKLTLETLHLGYGETVQADAKLTGGKGTITYTAVDANGELSDVVSIDQNGLITAGNSEGTAIICVTATAGNQTLHKSQEIHVWGAWGRKGFSWETIKNQTEKEFEAVVLPKWKSAWSKIEYNNEKIIENLKNTVDTEIQVFPSGETALGTYPEKLQDDFKMALSQELSDFDFDLLDYSEYAGKPQDLVKAMLQNLVDNPNVTFKFKSEKVTYTVTTDPSSISGIGAALYGFRLTADSGKYYKYGATITSPSQIALAMEYMKGLFVKEYNSLAETVKSGTLDMVGVNKIKDYVQKWIKGKAVDYMNANGKQWMDQFGTRMKDLDTMADDVKALEGFDLKDTQPKNVINKITGYQNKVVKFITDVLALGDCP